MDSEKDNIKKLWLNKAKSLGYTVAAQTMATLYPADFEAYMIAFELCDSKDKTLDFFTFPIMPTQISIEETPATKIENTFGGVNAMSSSVYVPKKISLSGNFGRQFKMLIRNNFVIPLIHQMKLERAYDMNSNTKQRNVLEVSNMLKSGYGCFKVLQSICNRSVEVDEYNECNKLIMYNMAYGESYVVKVNNFRGSQSLTLNGIWNYDLTLQAICPLHLDSSNNFKKQAKNALLFATQSALNVVTSGARDTLRLMSSKYII